MASEGVAASSGRKVSTGYAMLDEALQGGFLTGSAIVLSAPASDEVPPLLRNFLITPKGEGLLLSRTLSAAQTVMQLQSDNLNCLICGDKPVPPSKNIMPGKGIDNLTELNFQINEAISSFQPKRLAIDILSDILLRHKALQTRKWLAELLEKLKSKGITTLAAINPNMHTTEEVEAVIGLFDGNLEIVETISGGEIGKTLRIRWMHGIEVAQRELPLQTATLRSGTLLNRPTNNLPTQLTAFVGRSKELAEARQLLQKKGLRLITFTGPAGVGKTRLAIQLATDVLDQYADGVWFVELAPLSDPALVPQTVASVLSVLEQPGRAIMEILSKNLQDKRLLLVLDNCEHLIVGCAQLAEALLRACPNLMVMATSREALGIVGETAWAVPSLSFPDLAHSSSVESLTQYDSVQLFVDRGEAVLPTFRVTDRNAQAVAQVCIGLDGIPLAIEMAAARVKSLSVEQIASRLDDRFRLLTGGSRTALPRHKTLRAAMDWSYELLSEQERIVLRRLSVFAGGFTLEAAEKVCPGKELSGEEILNLLTGLVDKSLVIADAKEDGSIRYRLLEIIRQYAREKLRRSAEEEAAQDSHLTYYLAFAEQAYLGRIEAENDWLGRLEMEHDNLRTALEWARGRRHDEQLQLAGALAWFWHLHSHLNEGRERLAEALAGRHELSTRVARALWGAGNLAAWQGDVVAARQQTEESLQMWRELGDQMGVALAFETLGWTAFFSDDDSTARRHFEQSLEVHKKLGNRRLINRAMLNVCQILVAQGEVEVAEPMAKEALTVALEIGDPRNTHFGHHFLADCSLIRSDVLTSERLYGDSLKAALASGNPLEAAVEVQGIAMSVAGQSRVAKALRLDGAATAKFEALGVDPSGVRFWEELKARYFGPARNGLGERAAAAAWEEGKRMGFERAVEYALDFERD